MTPEEIDEQTRGIIEHANQLVQHSTNAAIMAMAALESGNWPEYWSGVAEEAQARLDEYYEHAKSAMPK